jgi:hypothetical protein
MRQAGQEGRAANAPWIVLSMIHIQARKPGRIRLSSIECLGFGNRKGQQIKGR